MERRCGCNRARYAEQTATRSAVAAPERAERVWTRVRHPHGRLSGKALPTEHLYVGSGPIRSCLAAALCVVASLGTASTSSAAAGSCHGTRATPSAANAAQVRHATICLLNRERARHGLPAIRANAKLNRAATKHSLDMVAEHYFDHIGPRGDDLTHRARAAHYLKARASWFLGENIAWGSGSLSTPASIVRQWMHSPPHRANILNRSFRDVGLGVATGAPSGGAGATYTLDFGRIS